MNKHCANIKPLNFDKPSFARLIDFEQYKMPADTRRNQLVANNIGAKNRSLLDESPKI